MKKHWIKNQLGINSNIYIYQDKTMFNYSIDTILLGNFVKLTNQINTILEIGANNGALSIFVANRSSKIKIDAIEIQEKAFELLKYNVNFNKLESQITPILGDFNEYQFNKLYDQIIVNPPFYELSKTKHLNEMDICIKIANTELKLNLEQIIKKSKLILKNKGYLSMVLPISRLNDLFLLINKYQMNLKLLQLIFPRINAKPILFLAQIRNHQGKGYEFSENIYLHNENAQDSSYRSDIISKYLPLK